MFYVKAKIAEGVTIRAEIIDENIFTVCPECGGEHWVDLQDAVIDGQLDLYGTAIYCDDCSKTRVAVRLCSQGRELHLGRWEPDESERPALVAYFKDYYEGVKFDYGEGDEQTTEALALYRLVAHNPLRFTKDAIQGHFADMFSCVGGQPEKYYDKDPEVIRLINLTVSPDPLEED